MKKNIVNTLDTILAQNGYNHEDYLTAKGYDLKAMTFRPRFMKIAEVARHLSCSRSSVYRMMYSGKLRVLQINGMKRIKFEEVDRLIEEEELSHG